jgi:hypothetical protein
MQPPINSTHFKVQLFISCRKLRDLDVFSKSDPVCHISIKNHPSEQSWISYDKTERKMNNLNPDFSKVIDVKYYFEKHQPMKFELIDDDGSGTFDYIGEVETTLGTIMGSKG